MNIAKTIEEVIAGFREVEGGPPYFMSGHRVELAARLAVRDQSTANKDKKYPMILLFLDAPATREGNVIKHRLNMAIMTYSKKERNAEERLEQVIDEKLRPVYEAFKQGLVDSGLFIWEGDPTEPPHTAVDRPNWGVPTGEGNERQYFKDPVDAIEITELELNAVVCANETEDEDEVIVITAQGSIYVG